MKIKLGRSVLEANPHDSAEKAAKKQFRAVHKANYKIANGSWAGGNNSWHFELTDTESECSAEAESERVWSTNGKWSGLDCDFRFCLHKSVIVNDMIACAGLLNIFAEKIAKNAYRAKWLQQSRGFGFKVVDGWIIRGVHVTAKDQAAAFKKVAAMRAKSAKVLRIKRIAKRANIAKYAQIWVGVNDSIKAGNCSQGTDQFAKKFSGLGALRADFLIEESKKYGVESHAQRAVAAAISARYN